LNLAQPSRTLSRDAPRNPPKEIPMLWSQAMKPQHVMLCGWATLPMSGRFSYRTQEPNPGGWPT
jgi:hypothetical protein